MAERILTYSAALNEALREEMQRDPSVFLMGEDLCTWGDDGGVFGVTKGLAKQFGPERVRDTPISEQGFVALGVGAAITGMRPVVELMYGDFLALAMEPLVNQAAKIRYMFGGQVGVPLVVRTNLGASGGKAAQHSQSLEAWLMHVPGLKVVVPRTPADAKGLLTTSIRDDNPVIFLEHKLLYFTKGPVPAGEHLVPLGQAATVRAGTHLTIVGTHVMVDRALEAASELLDEGIDVEVIDLRSLVPLDIETVVSSVERTTRLLICHESAERAGWAGEVAMAVIERAFDVLDAPIGRVCGKNVPIPYSESLEPLVVPQVAEIAAAARALLAGVDIPAAAAF
jgi:pyruvate/2-oxoglutarate/acetoin dehydrogenase E1 component